MPRHTEPHSKRDLDDEIDFHFASVVEQLMRDGATRAVAEAEARRRFGDVSQYRRELERIDHGASRKRRRREMMDATMQTLRSAMRGIRRSPGLSIGVVLAFALGIGANATMFGIVDRLLLSPPDHIADANAVHRVLIARSFLGRALRVNSVALDDYEDLVSLPQFAGVAAYSGLNTHTVGRGETARRVIDLSVTGSYWSVLGVKPVVGRFFGPEEDRAGGERVVVLGWSLWQSMFDGDAAAIGRTIDFGFGEYTIVGVAPKGFTGVDLTQVDMFVPLQVGARDVMGEVWLTGGRGYSWVRIVARLAEGATVESAEAAGTPVHRRGRESEIERGNYDANARVVLAPLIAAKDPEGPKEARVAAWLAGVSAIVLLIACVNVANLLLARSVRLRRELAIRLALGVSRRRLVAAMLVESVLLALMGGGAAILVAMQGGSVVRTLLLPNVAWTNNGLSPAVFWFTLAVLVLTGLFAAVVPAISATRPGLDDVLRATSGGITRSTSRVRSVLSMAQAALSVVLLVGAGLFVRSLGRVHSIDLGFDLDRLLVATPVAEGSGLDDDAIRRYYADAAVRLEQLPEVRGAAWSIGVPFWTSWSTDLRIPGIDSIPTLPTGGPYINAVSPSYMRTMDLRIGRGRDFEEADLSTPGVAIVNQRMADLLWPGGDPVGACLILSEDEAPCTTVVGVVETARRGSVIEDANAQYYVPVTHPEFSQRPEMMFIRVTRDDAPVRNAVRAAMLEVEPRLRYVNLRPLAELTAPELRSWQLGATMFTVFGLLALVVAGIGLYSVLAFDVAQRTREIGLRSALGAGVDRLMANVLARSLRVTLAGVAIGVIAALLLAPRVEGLLFRTSPRDPATFALVFTALLVVAVVAAAVPAWRAARVDPNVALRAE